MFKVKLAREDVKEGEQVLLEERIKRECEEKKSSGYFSRQTNNLSTNDASSYLHLSTFPLETVALFLTFSWLSSTKKN